MRRFLEALAAPGLSCRRLLFEPRAARQSGGEEAPGEQHTACNAGDADVGARGESPPGEAAVPALAGEERREQEGAAELPLERSRRLLHDEDDRTCSSADFEALLAETRAQLCTTVLATANRYGDDAQLPAFDPKSHVPVLALINPQSGAKAGSDILAAARRTPYYRDRFFNSLDVLRDQRRGGLLDVFRVELCLAKEEARSLGLRARVISGGGDGTACLTLFILFAALRADPSRAEEGLRDSGNGFIWTDDEMEACFPALAQLPLGTGNDVGHALGWGNKYPGDAELWKFSGSKARAKALRSLQAWMDAAVSPTTRTANFDVFGIMPLEGADTCDFKLCKMTGRRGIDPRKRVDGSSQILMKEAGVPVPLFLCLKFSAGLAPYVISRFEINRHEKPLQNKLELVRQALAIVLESVPAQLRIGLEGVQVYCGGEHYFPPRSAKGNSGARYREVGLVNTNWHAGGAAKAADRAPVCARLCSRREPAKFNDGKMDLYRLKLFSVLKNPGPTVQVDKREGGTTLTYAGGHGKGLFFQWDGETRFAFSPSGAPFNIHIRQILKVPVVLGPQYDARASGDPDNGLEVRFGFTGEAPQREAARRRILRGVHGELIGELNATPDELRAAGLQCG